MRKILAILFLFVFTSCKAQDYIDWVETSTSFCAEGYGLIYNQYTVNDARKITSSDSWTVPSKTDYETLADYLGAGGNYLWNSAGGKLKETGFTYWDSPNSGATNLYGFNARGGGNRAKAGGVFQQILKNVTIWTSTSGYAAIMYNDTARLAVASGSSGWPGRYLRIFKSAIGIPNGVTGTYTGNDGKKYRTIVINQKEWLADNLQETKFRNGDIIPWYGANQANYFTNAEWAALTTAGVCAYNNDVNNVGCGFQFP